MRYRLLSVATLLVLVIAWVVVTATGAVRPLLLPSPADLGAVIAQSWPDLLVNLGFTLLRQLAGFLIGTAAGIAIGLLMASSRVIRAILDPIVEILRPVPPLAIIPLLILWLGIGAVPQILLVAFGCFVILVVSTYEAVRNVPRLYLDAARTLGARPLRVYGTVVLPAVVPALVGTVRVAAAASFGLVVAAEFMGAQEGIGYYMILAQRFLRTDRLLVAIAIIGIVAWLVDQGIRLLERRLTRWSERHVPARRRPTRSSTRAARAERVAPPTNSTAPSPGEGSE